MRAAPISYLGRTLLAVAILFIALLAVPEVAHAHASQAGEGSVEMAATASHGGDGVWLFGHCDDGPSCSGAKSLLVVDRVSAQICLSPISFTLEANAYQSAVLGCDPPVPILSL